MKTQTVNPEGNFPYITSFHKSALRCDPTQGKQHRSLEVQAYLQGGTGMYSEQVFSHHFNLNKSKPKMDFIVS